VEKGNGNERRKYRLLTPIATMIGYQRDESIKLCSVEALIYLCENVREFAFVVLQNDELLSDLCDILTYGHRQSLEKESRNAGYGVQLMRSCGYALALLWKLCVEQDILRNKLRRYSNRIFEGSAQCHDVACYCVHLSQLVHD